MASQPEEKKEDKDIPAWEKEGPHMANVKKYLVKWGDLLKVGIEELDKEHKLCVDYLNILYNEPNLNNLLRLKRIFIAHLDTEQRLFEKYNYKEEDRRSHNIAHGVMVKFVNESLKAIKASGADIVDEDWIKQFATKFKEHAFEYDSLYADYLAAALEEQENQKKQEVNKEEMQKYMHDNGFWSLALWKTLQMRGCTVPKDLSGLSEEEMNEVLEEVKAVGFMGAGVQKFKAAWSNHRKNPKANERDLLEDEVEAFAAQLRGTSSQWVNIGKRGLLG